MKRAAGIFLFLLLMQSAFSQSPVPSNSLEPVYASEQPFRPYPKSIIDVGAGIGVNYGIFGGQLVLGYKGSGLLAAAGTFDGMLTYAIGAQFSYDWIYLNASWATVGSLTEMAANVKKTIATKAAVVMLGARINLIKSKKLYLQPGIGYIFESTDASSGLTFGLGLGFRIAFKKETSGAKK